MQFRTPILLTVRAGTKPVPCASCSRAIYWMTTANGKRMPVNCATGKKGVFPPTETANGIGEPHWADCPNASQHRKANTAGVGK